MPISRETMLLANNVLLIAAAGSVLLGTLYPLFLDALEPRQDLRSARRTSTRCSCR